MQSRNAFIGALEMHLGPVRETTYDLSGSLPSSTRPSAVIPMADSPRATEQLISDFNNVCLSLIIRTAADSDLPV